MQINPYLHFSGNCESAFKYYEKALGAKIQMMMTFETAPPEMGSSPEWAKKIMHGSILIDGEAILGADAPPQRYLKPQGFSITLTVPDPADAERKFKALAEGGGVEMPFQKTFFAKGFGMCVDQFGIPWMVISPTEEAASRGQ
jgi:PhnB protein